MKEHKLGSPWSADDDPVFASASGRPLYWRNVSKQGLEVAAERAELNRPGLAKLSMHGLRNTFASHLILDLKLDVVQVSKQLGHVRPSITSDTYARLFDQARHVSKRLCGLAATDGETSDPPYKQEVAGSRPAPPTPSKTTFEA